MVQLQLTKKKFQHLLIRKWNFFYSQKSQLRTVVKIYTADKKLRTVVKIYAADIKAGKYSDACAKNFSLKLMVRKFVGRLSKAWLLRKRSWSGPDQRLIVPLSNTPPNSFYEIRAQNFWRGPLSCPESRKNLREKREDFRNKIKNRGRIFFKFDNRVLRRWTN